MRKKTQEANGDEEKKLKVKKGWVGVRVGTEGDDGGFHRFEIPISHLHHPLFKPLLDKAHEVYGYHTAGPLKLPSSVDDFLDLRWMIEKESNQHHQSHHRHHHRYLSRALSFNNC
ncbi:auxin-induced protein 6B-like [Carica papaya]|uniref:auxin-induced protein 6B-like n=1 Tax=Carica papaya TaxID=3649 RepID=UPI000B8C8A6A|nr:auxin-induced protein 6B-like [Carica papaya]